MEKEGSFDEFLNHKSGACDFVFVRIILIYIGLMGLEDAYPVSGAATDTIVIGHYFAQLIEVLENVYTNASIKPSGLQQPQILLIMLALCNFHDGFEVFLCLVRVFYYAIVYIFHLIR